MKEMKMNTIVVLGASGDLAFKKTFPSIYNLYIHARLPTPFRIIGFARTKMDRSQFIARISLNFKHGTNEQKKGFLDHCYYMSGDYDSPKSYMDLSDLIATNTANSRDNRLFYMALPPTVFSLASSNLKKYVYSSSGRNVLVVEKPFGTDSTTCEKLLSEISRDWKDDEIYRIDHYLGKEMVQNIQTLRFANTFIPEFSNRTIASVHIILKEKIGTEGRGGYFDSFGIIKDVVQNHMMQMLALIAMEQPKSLEAAHVRAAKTAVLKHVGSPSTIDVCLGQYITNGEAGVLGYRDDDNVPNDSKTPTFACLVLKIANDRWTGVPFVLECGKALHEQKVEIVIKFKNSMNPLYEPLAGQPNELVIRVQPGESITIRINQKPPGITVKQPSPTQNSIEFKTEGARIPDAYEALLFDIYNQDQSFFVGAEELREAWRILDPILAKIDQGEVDVLPYQLGSRGPASIDKFIARHISAKPNL